MANKHLNISKDKVRVGLQALRKLVLDNMACGKEQGYLIICWAISSLLLDSISPRAMMKFSGGSASGKTTAAKLLSKFLYDEDKLEHILSGDICSMKYHNPLIILDAPNINKAIKNFLLNQTTGGSNTIGEEHLVLISAIEPLEEPELINRTLDIEFTKAHRTADFVESSVLHEIGKQREDIIFVLVALLQNIILPEMENGIKRNLHIIRKAHSEHSKCRVNEHLALMMLILEKLLPYMILDEDDSTNNPAEIYIEWLRYQDRQAVDG